MNNDNNHLLAFIAIPIALLALGAFLVKAAIAFFNSLGALFTSIATSFAGFAKLLISVGLIAAVIAVVGGIVYAGFYCILRYIRTVRKVTAFKEEIRRIDSNLREYLNEELKKIKMDVKCTKKEVDEFLEEFTRPPTPIASNDKPPTTDAAPANQIDSNTQIDPIKSEVMISNQF